MEPATPRRPEHGQGQQFAEERQEEQEAQAGQVEAGRQEVSHLAGCVSGFIRGAAAFGRVTGLDFLYQAI